MIWFVEIPHQRPARCWVAINKDDAVDKIVASNIRWEMPDEMTFENAVEFTESDLSSLLVFETDEAAVAALADDDVWSRHGGGRAHDALREKLVDFNLVNISQTPSISDALILDVNQPVLTQFFAGIASCDFYDGLSHQLYLDLDDMTLSINTEVSDNSWLQRDDGSLIQISRVSGYCDFPEEERYNAERGDDLADYGYQDWLNQLAEKIREVSSSR